MSKELIKDHYLCSPEEFNSRISKLLSQEFGEYYFSKDSRVIFYPNLKNQKFKEEGLVKTILRYEDQTIPFDYEGAIVYFDPNGSMTGQNNCLKFNPRIQINYQTKNEDFANQMM
jgi:hypothetical protein